MEVWENGVESTAAVEVPNGIVSVATAYSGRKVALTVEDGKGSVCHCDRLRGACVGVRWL
jgi:hypothetical protein